MQLLSLFVLVCAAHASEKEHDLVRDLPPDSVLRIEVPKAKLRIMPVRNGSTLTVDYGALGEQKLGRVSSHVRTQGRQTTLKLVAPHSVELTVEIAVPETTHLVVRLGTGEIEVGPVAGNKDLRVRVGDITMEEDAQKPYEQINARAVIGSIKYLDAQGREIGPIDRQFEKKYRVKARIVVGDVTIRSTAFATEGDNTLGPIGGR